VVRQLEPLFEENILSARRLTSQLKQVFAPPQIAHKEKSPYLSQTKPEKPRHPYRALSENKKSQLQKAQS